jgi:hypothetical protein
LAEAETMMTALEDAEEAMEEAPLSVNRRSLCSPNENGGLDRGVGGGLDGGRYR